jgi:hypothetical protein
MTALVRELRRNPLLWLVAFVPVVFVAQALEPEAMEFGEGQAEMAWMFLLAAGLLAGC